MSEQPPPRAVQPPVDLSAGDTETLVDLGLIEEPPVPSADPPAPLLDSASE